ncbi:MAG: hypothetical protein HY481_00335 [Candidatus Vogelbacteria bacterium]|nr:hypothetical protein [Candidatus Vogelbacteria bacterium]
MNRLKPEFALRLSLAVMYIYSGYSLVTSPTSWTQFVPFGFKEWLAKINFPVAAFVQVQGAVELAIAAVFLLWFLPRRLVKWLAFIAALEMALILIFGRIDLVTFRDIGLLGAFLALFLIYARR